MKLLSNTMNVRQLRQTLERQKGQRQQIEWDLNGTQSQKQKLRSSLKRHEQAREIIKEVGIKTQRQLQYNISEITSLALEAVFDDPYKLVVEFVDRRNKTECDLYFRRNGKLRDPLGDGGFGAVNIASEFGLRPASWSMKQPKTRNILMMDEPLKELKQEEANYRALRMAEEISKKLNIQIIMVSDERVSREATIETTDRLFEVVKTEKVSNVKVKNLRRNEINKCY